MRVFDPEVLLHITNKCVQDRYFLLPTQETNELIRGWLARSLAEYPGVEVYAFIFLSNHFHLLLRDNTGDLPGFMGYFKGNLAKAVNRMLGRKRVSVFERSYESRVVLTDGDAESVCGYVLTNAVKEDLVARATEGPFFSSLEMALEGRPRSVSFLNRTRRHDKSRGGREVSKEEVTDVFALSLAPLPGHRGLSLEERRRRIEGLVGERERLHARRRRAEGKEVLGARRLLRYKPWMRPRNPSVRGPRDPVYSRDRERAAEYERGLRELASAYREAFARYRRAATRGRRTAVGWPAWTYPPSSIRPVVPAGWEPRVEVS